MPCFWQPTNCCDRASQRLTGFSPFPKSQCTKGQQGAGCLLFCYVPLTEFSHCLCWRRAALSLGRCRSYPRTWHARAHAQFPLCCSRSFSTTALFRPPFFDPKRPPPQLQQLERVLPKQQPVSNHGGARIVHDLHQGHHHHGHRSGHPRRVLAVREHHGGGDPGGQRFLLRGIRGGSTGTGGHKNKTRERETTGRSPVLDQRHQK